MRSILILLTLAFSALVYAQGPRALVQVSGLVVRGDSLYGIPDVHIFSPKTGRGDITSYVGYFSFPAFAGDTLIVSSAGYKRKHYQVPDTVKEKISIVIELIQDTLILPVVDIFPWPTEKLFKDAFLALELNNRDVNNMRNNLNEQVMKRMLYSSDASGAENHRYYMQKQTMVADQRNTMVSPAMVFGNPFAWHRFIQDIRKKKFKSTLQEEEYEEEE
ncbi:MAG: carboxypeptidase-like regulatory domain-containing protein [Cytophagaceae bacterium]|jgi:hypothetical protein|nr:carboxypeptidase-like regulatory domain-containing protein [Cytophagaceae bacterium]